MMQQPQYTNSPGNPQQIFYGQMQQPPQQIAYSSVVSASNNAQNDSGMPNSQGQVPQIPPSLQQAFLAQQHTALPPTPSRQDSYSYRAQYGSMSSQGNIGTNPDTTEPKHSVQPSTSSATRDERTHIYTLVSHLLNPSTRAHALQELSRTRDAYDDLAIILFHSYGVLSTLLLEITSAYHILTPELLHGPRWTRICNALALLQCIAGHEETRNGFLSAYLTLYLYPFLSTPYDNQCFQNLKLTSLGVLGALVKNDSPRVIRYLIDTDAIPVCIRVMETGNELSQTVAVFVLQKVLTDPSGLAYMCDGEARLRVVTAVLVEMLRRVAGVGGTYRYVKHVVRCFEKMGGHPVGRGVLREVVPKELKEDSGGGFGEVLREDAVTRAIWKLLLQNLTEG